MIRGFVLFLSFAAALLSGCGSEDFTGATASNKPPIVWLSIAPPEGSTVSYTVHVYWGGSDPDGNIAYFEYVITDNESGVFDPADTTAAWHRTTAKDSVFSLTADILADSTLINSTHLNPYEFVRSHTFFIRAVDERGARSPAVYRSFTARTLSPTVNIDVPRAIGLGYALVPPMITFHWTARDYVGDLDEIQEPDSVRSILIDLTDFTGRSDLGLDYIRKNPRAPEWTKWIAYGAPDDAGRLWRPETPLAAGSYVFAVQAKDEAGAVSPVFDWYKNARPIRVVDRMTGPLLTLISDYMDTLSTSTTNTPTTIVDLPGGIPMSFLIIADASSYGAELAGYRYGWDIVDINDDDEWEITYTPFIGSSARSSKRAFFYGTHTFYVEVKDNSGYKSRLSVTINVVPFTMERPLLLIDDWDEGEDRTSFVLNMGRQPNDAEHDQFWADVLDNVAGFSPSGDVVSLAKARGVKAKDAVPYLPSITLIAKYKCVIWNARGYPLANDIFGSGLERILRYGSKELNFLPMYMAAGGKLLLCGEHVLSLSIDKTRFPRNGLGYPLIFRYEIAGDNDGNYDGQEVGVRGVGENSFPYQDCCLNVYDMAYGVSNLTYLRWFCRAYGARSWDAKKVGLRAAVSVDATYDFPRLDLRPEVSDPGQWYSEQNLGLDTDIFNPAYFGNLCNVAELTPRRPCFQPMYALECLDKSSAIYGATVAFWTSRWANKPNPDGVAGRSAVWGFTPVYFRPAQVRQALGVILFDEWKLEPKQPFETRTTNRSE